MKEIVAPTSCPCCGSKLVEINFLLYCKNVDCNTQSAKKIEHFAKTLKIKGLGPASIAKLDLVSIEDLYSLSEEDLAESLSSEKLAEKLYGEIVNSLDAPLELVLPALSIPLIGKSAAEKLSSTIEHISEINRDNCATAGLGPKATENLIGWLETNGVPDVPFSYKFSKKSKPKATQGVVCISGKLNSVKTKAIAKARLEELGYLVKDTLTKDVTILVNESGQESSKTKKARESGIEIITNLKSIIGENI